MAQLVVYIDETIKKQIEKAAKSRHTSISKWVTSVCLHELNEEWPKGLLDLCGSIKDDSFQRPEQLDVSIDTYREAL